MHRPSVSSSFRHGFLCCARVVFCLCVSMCAAKAETHVVKKRETLSGIAREHRVAVRQIIEANGLSRSGHIQVGQRLTIPGADRPSSFPATKTDPGIGLATTFQRTLDSSRVQPGRWKYVVVHHSATTMGSARNMDRYHREQRHMENGLAYHFVIGNGRGMGDGQIVMGQRWSKQLQGGHLASETLNQKSIGICLVGNFDRERPTRRQMQSLTALTQYLLRRCSLSKSGVKTHQQINTIGTRCPGRLFDEDAFLRSLK
jgi:LysM repeat protein